MSLLDALLSDPFRDPHEVYIALRSDGQRGSGTITDPYDGGTRQGPALDGILTCDRLEFVVGTQFPHGLTVGQSVTITGARGPASEWFDYSGTVKAIVSPLHFLLHFKPGTAIPPAPPDVESTAYPYITVEFILPVIAKATIARIYWPVAKVSVDQLSGLPLFGAVTVSDIEVSGFAGTYAALGPDEATGHSLYFRLSFLPTTDYLSPEGELSTALECSVARVTHCFDEVMSASPHQSVVHLGSGTFETRGHSGIYLSAYSVNNQVDQVHVGFVLKPGQRLLGSGIGASTIRLVLPVDEINQITALSAGSYPPLDHAEIADLTVDCNAPGHAAPYGVFPAPYTCGAILMVGSFMRISRVRAIQFCVQARAECFAVSILASYLPQVPGGRHNIIEDCIIERPGENNTHETSLLGIIGNTYADAISPVVRNNYTDCHYVKADGTRVSSEVVAVATLTRIDDSHFKLTTKRLHHRAVGNNVLLNNIRIGSTTSNYYTFFNRSFKISAVNAATHEITCISPELVPNWPSLDPVPVLGVASIGADFHGPAAWGGTCCVTEGNVVVDCLRALYTDTGSTRDAVVRNNYYSNVGRGIDFDFNPGAGNLGGTIAPRSAERLTKGDPPNGKIATFEVPDTTPPLNVSVGNAVTISNAMIDTLLDNPYNGTFTVRDVILVGGEKRKFTYEMKEEPTANADEHPTADPDQPFAIRFSPRYQVRRFIYENNVCNLYAFDSTTALAPWAVVTYGYSPGPPFMFPELVFRDNHFRFVDNTPAVPLANGQNGWGFRLNTADKVLIENNVMALADPHLIHGVVNGGITAFNNATPAGERLPLFDDPLGNSDYQRKDTLEDKVQDALLFALL